MSEPSTPTSDGKPSVAVLLDNARDAIVAARRAGVEPRMLFVSIRDFDEVARAKARETRNGLAPQILGKEIHARDFIAEGAVELVITETAEVSQTA
jgi:hypothetical protein